MIQWFILLSGSLETILIVNISYLFHPTPFSLRVSEFTYCLAILCCDWVKCTQMQDLNLGVVLLQRPQRWSNTSRSLLAKTKAGDAQNNQNVGLSVWPQFPSYTHVLRFYLLFELFSFRYTVDFLLYKNVKGPKPQNMVYHSVLC